MLTGQRHDPALLAVQGFTPSLSRRSAGLFSDEEQAILIQNALAMVFPSRRGIWHPVMEPWRRHAGDL
jgi:hypothetical protein